MKGCRPLTPEEVESTLKAISDRRYNLRDKLMFQLGLKAGFRVSEILSLKIKDVYQFGKIPERVSVQRRNMKGKKESRSVILHKSVMEAITEYLASREDLNPDSPLFLNQNKTKAISRQQSWNILKDAYKICALTGKLGTHSGRKTFSKDIYEKSGHCLIKTSKALGHRDIKTTIEYLSFTDSEVDNLITG